MTQEHPITPSPELVQKWDNDWHRAKIKHTTLSAYVATEAARWGADQQLEQCEEYWMTHGISPQGVVAMRYALRPQPPNLKGKALDELQFSFSRGYLKKEAADTIRRALESLPD